MSRPPSPGVPVGRMSPHVPLSRVTCPLLRAAALGAAQLCEVSVTTGDIAPASLRYVCLTPAARVAGPRCLAGSLLPGCVPARPASVASMAPGDVYHGPCSLAGLGPVALQYRSCHLTGWSAGSPQCVRPWGCRPLRPVPLPRSVRVRVRCPCPLGACSAVRTPFVFCLWCPGPRGSRSPVRALCSVCVCWWSFCPPSSPNTFFCVLCICFCFSFFIKERENGARAHCGHRHGEQMQRCSSVAFSGVCRRCFVGGRAGGVRLACFDVCGCRSGWVRIAVSSFWCWLVRWRPGLWLWAVVILHSRRAPLGVKGYRLRAAAPVSLRD